MQSINERQISNVCQIEKNAHDHNNTIYKINISVLRALIFNKVSFEYFQVVQTH